MPLSELGENLCLSAHEQGIFLSLERQKKPIQQYYFLLKSTSLGLCSTFKFSIGKALPDRVNTLILQYGWEGLKSKFVLLPEAGGLTGIPVF